MKHLIIGDLHGKDCWKTINPALFGKLIFLGDYVDHWNLPDEKILKNLADIIRLKESYPEKIELLLGNHDMQYLHYPHFLCSGFRPSMQQKLTDIFNLHRNKFRIAYQRSDYIFTHAGITNAWHAEWTALPATQQIRSPDDSVARLLNKTSQTSQHAMLNRAGRSRGGKGNGGPTWADRNELVADALEGYHQVVGHTVVPDIEVYRFIDKSVTFIDVLDYQTRFYELDI